MFVRSTLLSFCLGPACIPLAAQIALENTGPRLVSPQEGEAIVQAALNLEATWDLRLRRGEIPKPDCSHFVHAVYADAGFPYDYVPSRDVFSGIEHFRRVTKPQPGDVIVWQGHIGIVVNPKEHSFYSSLNRGWAMQSYQSEYWTARGTARFYRFFLTDPPIPPLFLPSFAQATPLPGQVLRSPVRSSKGRPPVLPRPSAHHGPAKEVAQEQVAQDRVQRTVSQQRPKPIQASDSGTQKARTGGPVFLTSRATPSKEEVLAAFIQTADANGEQLLQKGLDSHPSVAIIDRFRIAALNVQDTSGVALLELSQVGAFQYGKAIPARAIIRHNLILSREKERWTLLMPQDLMCLSRHLAAIALHDHVTNVHAQGNSPDVKNSLRLLDDLLSERALAPQLATRSKINNE